MRLTITCLCLYICTIAIAQPVYETYTPANGLVDARVSGMVQDKYGRLIIYTREGFSIYDGQRFTNILSINNEEVGIVTNYIFLPDSTLYLVRFIGDPVKIEKGKVSYDTVLLKGLTEISGIARINDSTNLILTNHGLYLHINKRLKQLINKEDHFPKSLNNIIVGAVYHNKILLYNNDAAPTSLLLYDIEKEAILDILPNINIVSITQDKDLSIYLSVFNQGIKQIDLSKLNENKIAFLTPWFFKYTDNNFSVENLFFDTGDNIWFISPATGCLKFNKITHLKTFYSSGSGLFKDANQIFEDKENNYWFLTYGKGIQKLVQSNYEEVTTIDNQPHFQKGYIHNLPDGSVYINAGEGQFGLQNNHIAALPAISTIANAELIHWQNQYWHFTDKNNLVSDKNVTISFGLNKKFDRLQLSNKIKTDKEGNILIGGSYFYLLRKDGKYAATQLPYFTDNITADDDGNYWAICRGTGFAAVYKYKDEKLIQVRELSSSGIIPRCTAFWNKDTFLIGTRYNGLVFAKASGNKITPFLSLTREKGLSNNFILDIIKLNDHKIALATASGVDIISFAGSDTSIQRLSLGINIYDPVNNIVADTAGNIYAVSEYSGKLYKYTTNKYSNLVYLPAAFFSGIFVNKEKVNAIKEDYNYRQNNFLFEVAAPSYIDNKNITFYFSLKGALVKEQFNNNGNFEINNLEPGKYELWVRIVYPGNIYPEEKLYYQFKINQPFWKTWWFVFLNAAATALLIWYLIKNFYSRKLEKQKAEIEKQYAIEQERNRMAQELHDGLGSMLSGIKHSFSAMRNQMELNESQQIKFHANIDKLNETIKELRNISHSIATDGILKYGLENSLRDYCNTISQPGAVAISFTTLNTEKMLLTEEQAFHTFRIVQELINNTVKHSGAANAIVQLSYNLNRMYITVEDDGKGFEKDDEQYKKGMGLKNIESRIKILKGKIDYRTVPLQGTSVLIEIPCAAKPV